MAEINDISWKEHNEYAKNAEVQQKEYLKFEGDKKVIQPGKIEVTEPSFLSLVRSLLQEDLCNANWSDIPKLDELISKGNNCFSTDLIPRLAPQEKLQLIKEKISAMVAAAKHTKSEEKKVPIQYNPEMETIVKLVNMLLQLNKTLYDINAGRNRYHKE